ncbi:MAG: hypothetical protein B7Y45_10005 [Sphingomonas sp. 28-66-16]|nr:MAG: hypothetical protein B7Y45_10005 [Sphingomonas sp. 28-66-16]
MTWYSLAAAALAITLAAPVAAQDWGRPTGYENREANVSTVNYPGGRFVYDGRGHWTEYGMGQQIKARFDELARGPDWIDLNDPTRDVQIRLNLGARAILITERGGAYRPLYRIASVENGPRGGFGGDRFRGNGFGDRRDGYDRRPREPVIEEVEAGSWLVTQFDAQRVCPGVATRANGSWTGKWRTTRPTVMSVCEVRR